MCEIFVLYSLGKMIAEQAKGKGRSALPFVLLLIFLWVGGEIFGFILGAVLMQGEEGLLPYGLGLGGAIVGAVVAFLVVAIVPEAQTRRKRRRAEDDEEDEDDYEARYQDRRKRRRREETDEEES